MSKSELFLKRGDKVFGPHSLERIIALRNQNKLKPTDLISELERGPWTRFSDAEQNLFPNQSMDLTDFQDYSSSKDDQKNDSIESVFSNLPLVSVNPQTFPQSYSYATGVTQSSGVKQTSNNVALNKDNDSFDSKNLLIAALTILSILLIAGLTYSFYYASKLRSELETLASNLTKQTEAASNAIESKKIDSNRVLELEKKLRGLIERVNDSLAALDRAKKEAESTLERAKKEAKLNVEQANKEAQALREQDIAQKQIRKDNAPTNQLPVPNQMEDIATQLRSKHVPRELENMFNVRGDLEPLISQAYDEGNLERAKELSDIEGVLINKSLYGVGR